MNNIILNKNPLFDKEFLNKLFSFRHRETYAKIILLNMKEEPLEQIEGKITDGTINIDGKSAVRRTCNLTMVAENININEFYWGLKNKFKLEIGIKNTIDSNYPDIIWFKQGLFVITQFNTTQAINKWTIKIQGKDKMCLLNGDLSGQLPPTDFAVEEYHDLQTGEITQTKIPIKTIISKLLQEFALEMPYNIIINDIDEAGYDLLEYRGKSPFYLFKNILSEEIDNMSPDGELECYYQLKASLTQEEYDIIPEEYNFLKSIYIRDNYNIYHFNEMLANENKEYKSRIKNSNWFKGTVSDIFNIIYDDLLDDTEFEGGKQSTKIRFIKGDKLTEDFYSIIKIEYGDIPGYRATELVFTGELKSSAGETITSILDKIKNKFTNFEYYYDIDGKFIFQKKKEYLLTPWNSAERDGNNLYTDAGINNSQTLFSFTDSQLITSFQNTPKIQNLKNDYSVHGNRDNLALRMRYAIDNKPTVYTPIRVLKEKIVTLKRRLSDAKIVDEKIEYKYYDAPEQEPYNEEGLLSTDDSYQIIELLDKKINNLINPKIVFNLSEFQKIEKALNINLIGEEDYNWCLSLFSPRNKKNLRTWLGTFEDLKKIITILNEANTLYETPIKMSIIPTEDGYEVWTIIYPYFAKYPYSTSHTILIKDEKTKTEQILYKDNIEAGDNVIHYKVDWRELIYQMGLDYRQLNNTDNYYYYLKLRNEFISQNKTGYNKTGYEQYYIDLISNWRDLYDPNPQLQYDNSIKFNEIKKQSLLLDNDETNDLFDTIYIQNGYSLIDKDINKNILNYKNVYKLSHPIDSEINSIYPFYKSNSHFLDRENDKYYLENETTKKVRNIKNERDKNNNIIKPVVYDTLKDVAPERIYIKNDQDFSASRYREKEIVFTEKIPYKPYTYFIKTGKYQAVALNNFNLAAAKGLGEKYYEKNGESYVLTRDSISQSEKIYYRAEYIISAEYDATQQYFNLEKIKTSSIDDFNSSISDNEDSNGTDFKVLNYPSTTNLDSSYEQNASSDYMIYAQVDFLDQLEKEIITGNDTEKNLTFYIQNPNYVKLSNKDPLWHLYYRSTLYPLAYKTSEILSELENLVETFLNYESETVAYIDLINNIFKKYFLYLNNYNYNDINNFILSIIQKLYDSYSNGIKKFGEKSYIPSEIEFTTKDFLSMMEEIQNLRNQDFDSYEAYSTEVQRIQDKYSNVGEFNINTESFSCLYYIYSILLEEYNKINNIENNNYSSAIEALFHLNNLINNLNICIQKVLRNIELNYNQVSFVLKDEVINNILSPEKNTVINDKYKTESIIQLKTQFNSHIKTLNEMNQRYINGQAQKTQNQFNEIVNYIDDKMPKDILDENGNLKNNLFNNNGVFNSKLTINNQIIQLDTKKISDSITEIYNQIIKDTQNNIIFWIEELNNQKNNINDFILHNFVWTPALKIRINETTIKQFKELEKEKQLELINNQYISVAIANEKEFKKDTYYILNENNEYIQETTYNKNIVYYKENPNWKGYHSLYKSFMFLKKIKDIFVKDEENENYKNDINKIIDLLTYEDTNFKLFQELQDQLLTVADQSNLIKYFLEKFEDTTKDFQEYIILEDVNNFNEINSNKIYYLPIYYNKSYYNYNREKKEGNYWLKNIFDNPQLLTFWFDFLEPHSTEISKYSIPAVGIRSKVVNDKDVKSVHYQDIPSIIFRDLDNNISNDVSGYTYINLTKSFMNLFAISSKGKTAKERIEELLYNHSYCSEDINIQIIPVYNLEPNNKIYIRDDKCNINGTYTINKITVPLSFKKMMSITATKSISDII